MVNPVTCPFSLFEELNEAFEVQFSGLHVYSFSKTLLIYTDMQLKKIKWKH